MSNDEMRNQILDLVEDWPPGEGALRALAVATIYLTAMSSRGDMHRASEIAHNIADTVAHATPPPFAEQGTVH